MKNKSIAQETLQILDSGRYINATGKTISIEKELEKCKNNTSLFSSEELEKICHQSLEHKYSTVFTIKNQTTIAAILQIRKVSVDNKIMCLNFASAKNPGGGFINGAEAQEESIARSSGLYTSQLEQFAFYELHRNMKSCIYTDSMIYSPEVPVFRNERNVLIDEPNYCNIITSAAVNVGVIKEKEPNLIDTLPRLMHQRMDKMLALAYNQGNDTLILGAWGCSVFRNDPKIIGELFNELLHGKYKNVFKRVHFAVFTKNENILDYFKM